MRALQFSQFGEPAAVLSLTDLPIPEPGPGEVRLRLTHRPINPSDLETIRGRYGRLPKLPAVLGLEATGVIDALGEGVSGFTIGQRVVPLGVRGGTWAEYGIASAMRLLPVAAGVSDQTAAQFLANPVTTWVMLVDELGLKEGDWVLQTAAGSTLGRLVIQLARLKGYKTVNLVRRAEQVQELLGIGGDAAFATDDPDLVAKVRAVTGGKGANGAIEAVGGATGALALSCLRSGGTMIVYGMLSHEPIPLHSGEMLFKGVTVKGYWLTHWLQATNPIRVAQTLGELMQLMAQGHLVPPVEAEYDLAQFAEAIEHTERRGRSGKVILTG